MKCLIFVVLLGILKGPIPYKEMIVLATVTSIADNTFNSCGIDYLYLPASLLDFSGWNYFHNVEAIFYGGTEEAWAVLYTGNRANLDVVKISYEAKNSKSFCGINLSQSGAHDGGDT